MSTEKWLDTLESELAARKSSIARAATTLRTFTKTATYSTQQNAITISDQWGSYVQRDPERFFVTLNTYDGRNTLAKIEFSHNSHLYPIVRRVPYVGGARWQVAIRSRQQDTQAAFESTTFNIAVHSLFDGDLQIARALW